MTIDLYQAAASSPCRAVIMIIKELKLDANFIEVDLLKQSQKTPEFQKINPQQKVPALVDNGFSVGESRAIMMYLANKYAPEGSSIYPKDPEKRAQVDRMMFYDAGTFYKAWAEFIYPQVLFGKPVDAAKEKVFHGELTNLDNILKNSKYLASDDRTLADFSIFAELTFSKGDIVDFTGYPNLLAWLNKMKELPYHQEVNVLPVLKMYEVLQSEEVQAFMNARAASS